VDVDGDGKAELLLTSIKPSRLVALRSDGTQISFPNAGSPFMTPLGSGRFGSTARDDVFFSSGYLNATTGSMVPFGGPRAPGTAGNPPQDIWPRPVLFDLPALGGRVLAMPASSLDTMRPVISLYDAGGQLVYREIFAAPALLLGAARLRAAGKEHLVLQFEDRVLIYP
jgi:hypothetical protein